VGHRTAHRLSSTQDYVAAPRHINPDSLAASTQAVISSTHKEDVMPQEILTKEEAKRLDRFHELNREIVAGYKEAVSGQVRMLRAVWEITRDELWKLEYRKFADWLSFLYEAGVKYTARSTFYAIGAKLTYKPAKLPPG